MTIYIQILVLTYDLGNMGKTFRNIPASTLGNHRNHRAMIRVHYCLSVIQIFFLRRFFPLSIFQISLCIKFKRYFSALFTRSFLHSNPKSNIYITYTLFLRRYYSTWIFMLYPDFFASIPMNSNTPLHQRWFCYLKK